MKHLLPTLIALTCLLEACKPGTGKDQVSDAIPVLTTGGQDMPDAWIDQHTGHQVIRLVRREGNNRSFYFHNNPFIPATASGEGDKMVFYGETPKGNQLFSVDLQTLETEQLTYHPAPISGEIVAPRHREVIYQSHDSVFATHIDSKEARLLFVFPEDFKAGITTLNADETLLAGVYAGEEKRAIYEKYPKKGDYFNRIFEAKIPHTLFTLHIATEELKKIHQENTWLGHVQFSPTNPRLLMFCHEGPWHLVDRIWTIDIRSKATQLMHKRTVHREIAGHEFFSRDGQTIWFDLQIPRGETFYLAGADVSSGQEKRYALQRDEWSIHFNISPDQTLFAGDGGDSTQVAQAEDGRWLYLFRPEGDHLVSERLVNMQHHDYQLEPNVHFSPDGEWIIFRANFEGDTQIYAVAVEKSSGEEE